MVGIDPQFGGDHVFFISSSLISGGSYHGTLEAHREGLGGGPGDGLWWLSAGAAARAVEWTQEARVLPADGTEDQWFGFSVSISGDSAIIGAPWDDENGELSGSAYIFQETGSGWTQVARLLPDDITEGDQFGWGVSISGSTAIVGAWGKDDNGFESGAAYVFQDSGSGWRQVTRLVPDDNIEGHIFGVSVSIGGSTAIVGAAGDDDNGDRAGAAYVFQDSGSGWTQVAKLLPDDGGQGDEFGYSVSISENIVIIGAPWDDENGELSGSAYIFQEDGLGWGQVAKLLPDDGAAHDLFGFAVSISGKAAVIGTLYSESAYIFQDDGSEWTQVAKLVGDGTDSSEGFGRCVSISGETAIVGASGIPDPPVAPGSAFVFEEGDSGWTQVAKLLPEDITANDSFGVSVSIGGNTAIVGAMRDEGNGKHSGSAYIFVVPEPSMALLLMFGAFCLPARRWRQEKRIVGRRA
jgi:hypothetical protein